MVPDYIRRWNWGAFWLTWIWGINHNVYRSFLVFVPFVGLGVPFWLGAKGNELAWRANKWESADRFLQKQRTWAIAGWFFFVVGLMISVSYKFSH
ncbi:ribonuclease G [Sorangium sp. So ce1182]|uniref:ribonuclease G n=1 Tax=Sorangium sp. So ce1182 TaxID=3133334 RepID=UPI003F60E694